MSPPRAPSVALTAPDVLAAWLVRQRWFARQGAADHGRAAHRRRTPERRPGRAVRRDPGRRDRAGACGPAAAFLRGGGRPGRSGVRPSAAGCDGGRGGRGRAESGAEWAEAWRLRAERAYLGGYRAAAGDAAFLPATDAGALTALGAFELEKGAYEVVYEANHRPDWIDIPRRGLLRADARLRGRDA